MASKKNIEAANKGKAGASARDKQLPLAKGRSNTSLRKTAKEYLSVGKSEQEVNTESLFDLRLPIFLQMDKGNIYSYFAQGLILPTFYEKRRFKVDAQTMYGKYLALSNIYLIEPTKDSILLELVGITADEILLPNQSIALCSIPLPISRIARIHVFAESDKKDILSTSNIGDSGIIPEWLVNVGLPPKPVIKELVQVSQISDSSKNFNYSEQISSFDRFLGAIASVRNVPILYSKVTGRYANFSNQFFDLVNLFLPNIIPMEESWQKNNSFFRQLLGLKSESNPILAWIFKRARGANNLTNDDLIEFANVFLIDHADSEFREKGKIALNMLASGIDRKKAPQYILAIDHIDKIYLYLFAYLFIYGNRNSEDRTNFRIGLLEDVRSPQSELLFALLGYFFGYNLLRNYEPGDVFDSFTVLMHPNKNRIALKFALNSLFDFYLIEAIYIHSFQLKSKGGFEFIQPRIKGSELNTEELIQAPFTVRGFNILGKLFYQIENERLNECIKLTEKLADEIPVLSKLGLYCFEHRLSYKVDLNCILKIHEDIFNIRGIIVFFKKDFIAHLNKNQENLDEVIALLKTIV